MSIIIFFFITFLLENLWYHEEEFFVVIPGNRRVNICCVLLRGTYWANYATGLGASIHELGHCFDLAHTPKGIMARGFDDMNCVFTMWRQPTSPEKDTVPVEKSGQGRKFPMYNIS